MKKLIIGLGTGRCGTHSLSKLLGLQQDIYSSHEGLHGKNRNMLPWNFDIEKIMEDLTYSVEMSKDKDIVANTGLYYLPYVPFLIDLFDEKVFFIVLKREKEEVIQSFYLRNIGYNPWVNHDASYWAQTPWDETFPKFEGVSSKKEAIGKYWEQYYSEVERIARQYPDRFFILNTDELNDEEKLKKLFDFLGIENPVFAKIHINKNRKIDLLKRAIVWIAIRYLGERRYRKIRDALRHINRKD